MLSDTLLFIAGVIVGVIIVAFRLAYKLKDIYITHEYKDSKANIMKVHDEESGEVYTYINPKGFKQTLELMIDIRSWRKRGKKEWYTLTNKRRQNAVLTLVLTILFLVMVLAGYFIINVQEQEHIEEFKEEKHHLKQEVDKERREDGKLTN
jgi:uncharacterized protein YpmB